MHCCTIQIINLPLRYGHGGLSNNFGKLWQPSGLRSDWARRDPQAELQVIAALVDRPAVLSRAGWWAPAMVADSGRGNLVRSQVSLLPIEINIEISSDWRQCHYSESCTFLSKFIRS